MASVTQLAGMLPSDPKFRAFVAQFVPPPVTEDEAAQFIRYVCEVESRRQLAEDRGAEQRFHQFLRKPFVEWRAQQPTHRRAA